MSTSRDRSGADDLYDALGVGSSASDDEIMRAYRRLARERHPDANPHAEDTAFAELTDAYDVLHDAGRREAYDQTRRMRGQAARSAENVHIPVHDATGRADRRGATSPRGDTRGQAHAEPEFALDLTFEQACLGTTATVAVAGDWPCPACGGAGAAAASSICPECLGSGSTTRSSEGIKIRTTCRHCDGRGRPAPLPCSTCHGAGHHRATHDVTVRVPPGVEDGARIRIPLRAIGFDLVAAVRIAGGHPYFTRRENDITLPVPLTVAEAALGAVITVPTLTSAVAIRIPSGTPHGRTMRIRGRGVPHPDHPGDLLLTIEIVIPRSINEGQRRALEAFAAATTDSPRAHFERPVPGTAT